MASGRHSVGTQLSFALYGAANRMVRLHKPFLEPLGLTFPQYLVILELLNGAPLSVGALGARLDMDTGTITPLLKRLDAAGMVTRTRDPADERSGWLSHWGGLARDRAGRLDVSAARLACACGLSGSEALLNPMPIRTHAR